MFNERIGSLFILVLNFVLGSVVSLLVGLGTSGHLLVAALGWLAVFRWWDRCTFVMIVELGALYQCDYCDEKLRG